MKINGKPDGGGGGGVITSLSISANGTYTAGGGVDGFSPVDVDVQPTLEYLSVSANGTYTPGQGVDGYSRVRVQVPIEGNIGELSVSSNGEYFASTYSETRYDGWRFVRISVPDGDGTWMNPYNLKDAQKIIFESPEGTSSMYVRGFVTQINSTYSQTGQYGNADFYVGISNSGNNYMRAYRLNYFDGKKYNSYPDYASRPDIQIGDEVIMYGQFRLYNNVPQTIAGNTYLYAINGVYGVGVEPGSELYIDQNGYYSSTNYYENVVVSVAAPAPVTESLSVSVNGTYTPGQGVDGFSQVVVDVPQSVTGFTEKDLTERAHALVDLNNSASFVATDAFEDYKTLQTVTLPNCSIVYYAGFKSCESITSVSLPICKGLEGQAFYNCFRISSFYAPMVEYVGGEAFYNNKWMTADIDFPVCSLIDNYAFNSCSSITSVNLPECLSIGNGAFSYCILLSYLNIPECKTLGSFAFNNCSSLSTVTLTNLLSMGENTFGGCRLENLYLPKCLSVPAYAFQNNPDLSVISLPRVMSIGYNGFYSDSKISVIDLPFLMGQGGNTFQPAVPTSINLPIFSNMYYNASYNYFNWSLSLASEVRMSIGNKIYFVPSYTNGLGLSSILSYNNCTIYVDAAMYDKWVSANGWSSLSTIFSVEGDPTVPMLSFSDGLLYGKTEALFQYWYSSESYGIGIDSSSVRNVSLPECRYLSNGVFLGLSLITSITLPKCEYIEANVFSRCYNLETLEIPNCRYIGSSVFLECNHLTSITLTGSEVCTLASSNVFMPASIPCQIYVPASLYDAYLSAPNWSNISSRIHPIE